MTKLHFDESIARSYDRDSRHMFEPAVLDPTVDFLVGLASGGPALELGVGTGRVALPLARSGVPVHGIDISQPMIDELIKKREKEDVATTTGSYVTTRHGRWYHMLWSKLRNRSLGLRPPIPCGCATTCANVWSDMYARSSLWLTGLAPTAASRRIQIRCSTGSSEGVSSSSTLTKHMLTGCCGSDVSAPSGRWSG